MHGSNLGMSYMTGRMLIGGELVESKDGGWLESINPADETQLGRDRKSTRLNSSHT